MYSVGCEEHSTPPNAVDTDTYADHKDSVPHTHEDLPSCITQKNSTPALHYRLDLV